MREIPAERISQEVRRLCIEANYYLGKDILNSFQKYLNQEESPTGREILEQLLENARIAAEEQVPICQDTGFAVVFVELGQEVMVTGGSLMEAINSGVSRGYIEGYLRASIVRDPFDRVNTGDNTPPVVHVDVVPGDRLKLTVAPKGGGSENMSRLKILKPADGVEGVKEFVVDCVREAGPNPCPPVVVGVGIGGTFEMCALLAKKALLRPLGSTHPNPFYAALEEELLERINSLGIGPQGLGGRVTSLGVHIETFPCHIAGLPVAVNLNCHASRHKSVVL